MSGGGDALDVRLHAAADVEQEEDVDGHVFTLEIADLLRLAVLAENEILGAEAAGGAVVLVDHLRIDAGERDIAAELIGGAFRRRIGGRCGLADRGGGGEGEDCEQGTLGHTYSRAGRIFGGSALIEWDARGAHRVSRAR